jgi:predicted amidohydrolase YtcJ
MMDASMDPSWQEVKDALTAAVTTVPKGAWIDGVIGQKILENSQATRAALDALAPDHLVVLPVWTGHSALLNTAAMRKIGIREDEPDPQGGRYLRNKADGMFTGLALEYAAFRLFCRWSELATKQEAAKGLNHFFDKAARMGITTVQDMAMPVLAQRVVALLENDPPPIRVRVIRFGMTDEHGRLKQEGRGLPHNPLPLVTVSGTKWMIDGTDIEFAAAKREPDADSPSTSDELDFPKEEVEAILRESLQSDEGLMLHVVGHLATETVVNAMEKIGGKKVWWGRRVRFEHGYGLTPDLMRRAKELGVIVVPNPVHESSPLRSLWDAGIPVALGSDGPNNPYLNILLASTYPSNPKEAISREEAVTAYTRISAYAEGTEKDKGSLEPGLMADLAVLSQDIFRVPAGDLPKTESVWTMVGGKVVYDAKVLTLR